MERLSFKLEFADNGVVVTDNNKDFVNVYEENERGDSSEYTRRAISDSIADTIAHLLLYGSDRLEPKSIYKIKIEIR
jgi:hypothetical protein